jgi:polyferredoxin
MVKINKPKGLIRFASFNSIASKTQKLFNTRVIAYSFVLLGLLSLLSFLIFTRSIVETTLLKVPGTTFQKTDDQHITNLYTIEFVNKSNIILPVTLKLIEPKNATLELAGGDKMNLEPGALLKKVMIIKLNADDIRSVKTNVKVEVWINGKLEETVKSKFIGPVY